MSEQTPLLKDQPPPASAPPPPYQPSGVPQYQGGQPPPPPTQTTVVVGPPQPVYVAATFSDIPVQLRCPSCQQNVLTKLDYTNGVLTWLIVGLLLLLGFWLGCCLIPLCIDGLKDVNHVCPNCGHVVGTYKRL